jgi:hypothetical protein
MKEPETLKWYVRYYRKEWKSLGGQQYEEYWETQPYDRCNKDPDMPCDAWLRRPFVA